MSETSSSSGTPPKSLIAAIKRLLRPLVRMLTAKGVGLPAIIDILKETYVDVALSEFPVRGKSQTDSRISLLTGVHRKDVKRLREAAETSHDDSTALAPRSIGIGAQVVARWVGSPETSDDRGQPLPLPRRARAPGAPSFDALVEGVSKDVRPRAVLDEWLRLGVATVGDDGRVNLNQAAFVPEKGFDEKAFYLGRNIHDHLAAAAHNLLEDSKPTLERSVHYSDLTPASVESLNKAAEQEGMRALLAINRLALDLAAKDKDKNDATLRANFGLYFHQGLSIFNQLNKGDGVRVEDSGE
jgi:hypothetical protein